MAQSIGTVKKLEDGGYEGMLAVMMLNTKISIVPNETKENVPALKFVTSMSR